MRVAHVITRMIVGGAQENTLYNCEDLIRRHGDEVVLITGPATGPEGSLLERAEQAGVPVVIVPALARSVHPARDWIAYGQIKRALRAFRPDVVHTHSAKAGILGRLAGRGVGAPAVVHSVHGAPWHDYQSAASRELIRACEWFAARYCDHFICVANAMREQMVAGKVAPPEKLTTIYSGMEVEPFLRAEESRERVRRELGYGPDDVVVGKIARLFHLKGHDDVIRAAERVAREAPQAKFLFVGDGILAGELREMIRARGLEARFQFTGLVPPTRIPELIGAMDLLVHASLREGLARALPQALIAGKPVVSYDIDGAREVVIPGETGFLVKPRDSEGLAAAMIELARDPALRRRYGEAGRSHFTDQFRHERMTEEIRQVYLRVLDRTQGRGEQGGSPG